MRGIHAAGMAAFVALALPAAASAAGAPSPLDPQNWTTQERLTWSDYHALPGPDYSDPSIQPTVKKWKVALVVTDFPDKTFTISKPAGSTVFGTPTAEMNSVPRADVPAFYRDFLNKPQPLNHFQTMNRYWMEDTHGKYGVQLDAYGPYLLPSNSYQYFEQDFDSSGNHCPNKATNPCNKNFRTDARAAWLADVGQTVVSSYDNIFYVSAGEDESSTWQEFGNMRWATQDQVPDTFGPKSYGDLTQTNWAPTRYVPWTSWASSSTIWPNASGNTSIEAESSGMGTYAHELTHNLGIADNYNNPFGTTQQRSATGPWDMMSRGSFGGPGGTHARYFIPPTTGGSLGSQHNVRNKLKLGFVTQNQVLRLNRGGLAQSGMAVADVTAREVDPGAGLSGVQVTLDGGDQEPACTVATNPLCDGVGRNASGAVTNGFNNYVAEVVQQIGSDSFDPGHGVLLSKTKTSESSSCGTFTCFVWIIDAHPEDINMVDFVKPDGTPSMATIADQRQLDDATFNAGTNSGTSYEYEDSANRLHFYIINLRKDADGILHYTVGVQSLDGNGPQTRGVALSDAPGITDDGGLPACTFTLTNSGVTAATDPALHPQDATAFLQSDVYRLSASATGTGWTANLRDALATAKFGDSTTVPVYVTKADGAAANGTVTLTATSVSDPSKTATAVCSSSTGDVGGAVPATLSLTMGAPAAFGVFTPGVALTYTASTSATVISSAGDAALSVADPSATATGHLVNGTFALLSGLTAQAKQGAYAPVGGSANPTTLTTWDGPVSNDPVSIGFQQAIGSTDALRTGTYSKTLTFTLSTTKP